MSIKTFIKSIPVIGKLATKLKQDFLDRKTLDVGSVEYWENRYAAGGNSGAGSYNRLAAFKAKVINQFIEEKKVKSFIEFGCGDGSQLAMIKYESYIGFDVSRATIGNCARKFEHDSSKSFYLYDPSAFIDQHRLFTMDVSLSLDVVYHIVEDQIFDNYMHHLFNAARQYVIVYSSNFNAPQQVHVKHRKFTDFIDKHYPNWTLDQYIANPYPYSAEDEANTTTADFYVFKKLS